MRLADFILKNQEPILQAWEEFARLVDTPMPAMGPQGLRDHAEYILRSVALDMRTSQTSQEQIDKSHGLGPVTEDESAAQSHAITRLMAGFTLDQMVSEHRALRSSVLRLWLTNGYRRYGQTKSRASHSSRRADMHRLNGSLSAREQQRHCCTESPALGAVA